jgi:branched-chain amino acid transport system substrate-binding protein
MTAMRAWPRTFLVAVVVLAAACTSSEPENGTTRVDEVKIGVLAPLSKENKAAGDDVLHGAQLAAALVNGDEGAVPLAAVGSTGLPRLGGANVVIVSGDTAGDPQQGASQAGRLVGTEKVVGLVGAYDADVTDAASQRSERLRVPFVNGDASADFLTERGLDWFFRTGPTDRMLGEAFFSALGQVDGRPRKVAIVQVDDRPGNVVGTLTKQLAEEGGYQVVDLATFNPETQDPAVAVTRVRGKQPDAVFVVGSTPQNAQRTLKTFGRLGYTPPGMLLFGAGVFEPTVLQAAGQDGVGLFYSAAWSREVAGRNPAAQPVMEMYEEQFNAPMTEAAAGSFTAVLTMAKAIDDAGSIQPDRVRAALLNLDIPGRDTIMPWNGIRFDATHQNSAATGVVEQVAKDAFRIVFPGELAQQQSKPGWPLSVVRRG